MPRAAWAALSVATAATFLTVLDLSAVNVAFPSIERELDASARSLSWIVSGYSVTLASLFLLAGRVADRVGRRKTFVGGLTVFLVGSFLVGIAPGVELLVAARVVQASGGSFLMISGVALVLPAFPVSRRSSAIGVMGLAGALGGAVGPVIGAALVDLWSWRLIFLVNPPVGTLVLVLGGRFLPDPPGESAGERIDGLGVPIGVAGVAVFLLGVIQGESWGFGDIRVVALLVVGLGIIPVSVYRSAHHPRPLLDLALFKIRSFSAGTASFFLFACGFLPSLLLQSLVLQDLWDMPVGRTGLALTPWPIAAGLCSYPAGWLGDRFGHRWVCALGAGLLACAHLYLLLRLGSEPEYWSVFFPSSVLAGIGSGLTVINFQAAALSDVAPSSFAVAVATLRTLQQIGVAVGTALVITFLGEVETVGSFQRGYMWPVATLVLCIVVMAVGFPGGTAVERLAGQTDGSTSPRSAPGSLSRGETSRRPSVPPRHRT